MFRDRTKIGATLLKTEVKRISVSFNKIDGAHDACTRSITLRRPLL
jgi:hypothetical protein